MADISWICSALYNCLASTGPLSICHKALAFSRSPHFTLMGLSHGWISITCPGCCSDMSGSVTEQAYLTKNFVSFGAHAAKGTS